VWKIFTRIGCVIHDISVKASQLVLAHRVVRHRGPNIFRQTDHRCLWVCERYAPAASKIPGSDFVKLTCEYVTAPEGVASSSISWLIITVILFLKLLVFLLTCSLTLNMIPEFSVTHRHFWAAFLHSYSYTQTPWRWNLGQLKIESDISASMLYFPPGCNGCFKWLRGSSLAVVSFPVLQPLSWACGVLLGYLFRRDWL
jgi:hypothetical protein